MKALLRDIHVNGFATATDHPELSDPETQRQLGRIADSAGLRFSYDPTTASGTFIVDSDGTGDLYGPLERATILVTWLLLVFRRKERVAVDQGDQWEKLTPEAQVKQQRTVEMTVTAQRLTAAFPNLYPLAAQHATPMLNRLVKRGLLTKRTDGGLDVYGATPLLAHVVNEDEAYPLVTGHLRGEFEHLLLAAEKGDSLEDELYQLIQSIPEGGATMEVFQRRLGKPRNAISAALEALRTAGLIEHQFGKARGGYYVAKKEAEHDQ